MDEPKNEGKKREFKAGEDGQQEMGDQETKVEEAPAFVSGS